MDRSIMTQPSSLCFVYAQPGLPLGTLGTLFAFHMESNQPGKQSTLAYLVQFPYKASFKLGKHQIAHHGLLFYHTNKQCIKYWIKAIILKMLLIAWDIWTYRLGFKLLR